MIFTLEFFCLNLGHFGSLSDLTRMWNDSKRLSTILSYCWRFTIGLWSDLIYTFFLGRVGQFFCCVFRTPNQRLDFFEINLPLTNTIFTHHRMVSQPRIHQNIFASLDNNIDVGKARFANRKYKKGQTNVRRDTFMVIKTCTYYQSGSRLAI